MPGIGPNIGIAAQTITTTARRPTRRMSTTLIGLGPRGSCVDMALLYDRV
jgi:hypothetical protein